MFFKTKDSSNPIRELNRKVSRYKKWWGDRQDTGVPPSKKKKSSIWSKVNTIDDSFVYYEEI